MKPCNSLLTTSLHTTALISCWHMKSAFLYENVLSSSSILDSLQHFLLETRKSFIDSLHSGRKPQKQNPDEMLTLYTQNPVKIMLQRGSCKFWLSNRYILFNCFSFSFFYKGVILMLAEQAADRPHPWVEVARITGL